MLGLAARHQLYMQFVLARLGLNNCTVNFVIPLSRLGQDEERSGKYSEVVIKKVRKGGVVGIMEHGETKSWQVELQAGTMELGIIAPSASEA